MVSHFRGGQDWRKLGLALTTGSEEVCKLYDATLSQVLARNDDDSLGGVEGTLRQMKQADPDFVMGHVMSNWLGVATDTVSGDGLKDDLNRMMSLAENTPGITWREQTHAKAIDTWAKGQRDEAVSLWEDILVRHPRDMIALLATFEAYLFRGKFPEMRDSVCRVLPHWTQDMPYYGYVLGMKAFGMEETCMFPQAEAAAKEALSINPKDVWSTHTMCHILESTGRQGEVITMLDRTQDQWLCGRNLACHTYWHWALNHVEMGDYESALSILDDQISPRWANSESVFSLTDVASLLYRLQFEDVHIGDRWHTISDAYTKHLFDHDSVFYDTHIFMACLNGKDSDKMTDQMMDSMKDFVRNGKGCVRDVAFVLLEKVAEALLAYKEGDYGKAVDLINPIRYRIVEMGASNAQRDVFNMFLIQAAIRSSRPEHSMLARNLLNERKAFLGNSPMTDRWMAKVLDVHDQS